MIEVPLGEAIGLLDIERRERSRFTDRSLKLRQGFARGVNGDAFQDLATDGIIYVEPNDTVVVRRFRD